MDIKKRLAAFVDQVPSKAVSVKLAEDLKKHKEELLAITSYLQDTK